MKPHKHAKLIKAWADGAEIQHQGGDGNWYDSPSYPPQMIWYEGTNYRIKPEPRGEIAKCFKLESHPLAGLRFSDCTGLPKNPGEYWIKVIFDGKTGKPKLLEVVND